MPDEVDQLCAKLENVTVEPYGGVEYHKGTLAGKEVVVCCAGMGKANAAATTQVLITKFGAEKIIFSGIAGNMTSKIGIGDVVIGKTVLYHDAQLDMICQNPPFLKEYTGDPALIAAAEAACKAVGVKALTGKIATGDLFVGDSETKAAIEAKCAPDCVEMEGAAVSQIAAKNEVPCVILRAMSDNADEDGHEVLVVKKFSIAEYVATATKIVASMVESLYSTALKTPAKHKALPGFSLRNLQPVLATRRTLALGNSPMADLFQLYKNCSSLIRLSSSKSCNRCIRRLEPGAASG